MKFGKKQSTNRNLQKTSKSIRTNRSKSQIKQVQKQPTRKPSKTLRVQRKQAQIRGKTARLATL